MKLKYLGTAAAEGIPGIFCRCAVCAEATQRGGRDIRTRSQAIIDDELLIDFPPDTYWHMVRDGVGLPNLRHVLITHTHSDHLYLEELFYRRAGFCETRGTLTLYGNDALKKAVDAYLQQTQSSYEASFLACEELIPFQTVAIGDYMVTPLPAAHDRSENCYIYLIEKDGKRLLYGNDTGVFPETVWEFLKGKPLRLVSLDCTHGWEAEGSNHMGIPDLLKVKRRLVDTGCANGETLFAATHFSHNGGLNHDGLEAALNPHGFMVAFDGLEISI